MLFLVLCLLNGLLAQSLFFVNQTNLVGGPWRHKLYEADFSGSFELVFEFPESADAMIFDGPAVVCGGVYFAVYTEQMPITIPSMVRRLRRRCELMASQA